MTELFDWIMVVVFLSGFVLMAVAAFYMVLVIDKSALHLVILGVIMMFCSGVAELFRN